MKFEEELEQEGGLLLKDKRRREGIPVRIKGISPAHTINILKRHICTKLTRY